MIKQSTRFAFNINSFSSQWLVSSRWPALILITITVIIIYSNIYNAPFVFDDAIIKELDSNSANIQNFKHKNSIPYLTFTLSHKLWGLNVAGHHIVNVLIHMLNGFLVYFLSLAIFMKLSKTSLSPNFNVNLTSLFAAMVFVTHPVQTEAVTYTIQRTTSMAAMFYMASILFYLKARTNAQDKRHILALYSLSALCGISSILSKPTAASLPGAILLVEYLVVNRTWQGWRKIIPWFAIFSVLWVVIVICVSGVFSDEFDSKSLFENISSVSKETIDVGRWQYLCTQFNVLVIYIRLLFLPIHQNLDYLYSFKDGFFDGYTPIAFLSLMAFAVVGIWSIRKRPIISLAIFWFFITLSVESSIIPIRDAMFEHRLYLPMFGFAIFASWLLFYLIPTENNPRGQSWVVVACAIIVVLLGAATYQRNGVWQDEIKLWSDVVLKNPQNHRAHNNLGDAMLRQDKLDGAMDRFNKALRIKPNYAAAHNNLGDAMLRQNKLNEAITRFREALKINPDYAIAHNNLGTVLARDGRLEEAVSHYKKALQIDPAYAGAHSSLGAILTKEGKLEEAILHYEKALQIRPNYGKAHNNLGAALAKEGKLEEAVFHYKEALRTEPDYAGAYYNLGSALLRLNKLEESVHHYKETLRIKPDYAGANYNLGTALTRQGKLEEAIVHYKKALRIAPGSAKAHNNLGDVLLRLNRYDEALLHFKETLRIAPDNAEAHNNLGVNFIKRGELDDSIFHFKEALRIKPDYAAVHYNLGYVLGIKEKYDDAIFHYKEALRIKPDFKDAENNLEIALKKAKVE